MSVQWRYFLTDYDSTTNFSEKLLSTKDGNSIIGIISLRVLKLYVKRGTTDINTAASLHCDAVTRQIFQI